jgi:adenine C2-methylase RlmN of 23S rRNA A2503 and tRNA A37
MQRSLFPEADFTPHFSLQDASVNWDCPVEVGRLETRYVRRRDDYFVVYLSSQTACAQACRMCHLTATGQTKGRDATLPEMFEQARIVLNYYAQQPTPAREVHFNWMARGEPLANRHLLAHADELLAGLSRQALAHGLRPRHLISTIYPRELADRPLESIFVLHHPDLYYSIYSMSESFRRRWLPRALPAPLALDRLAAWQRATHKIFSLHHAYIADENDSEEDVHAICNAIEQRRLMVHINIVRYNSPSERHGTEPPEEIVQRNAAIYRERLRDSRVSVIPRVGYDVAASCGMFLGGEERRRGLALIDAR